MTLTERTRLGRSGEDVARAHLEHLGLRFVTSNWYCRSGEIDLVMRDDRLLVFVEVKTRRGDRAGTAEESLTPKQSARVLQAAEWFLAEHPDLTELIWRVDLIAITLAMSGAVVRFNHFENAVISG